MVLVILLASSDGNTLLINGDENRLPKAASYRVRPILVE